MAGVMAGVAMQNKHVRTIHKSTFKGIFFLC